MAGGELESTGPGPHPGVDDEELVQSRIYQAQSAHEEARLLEAAWSARSAGRRGPVRALVAYLEPKVRLCARDVLVAQGRSHDTELLADLRQVGWAGVFAGEWKALRKWRPDGGARLISYVGVLATRRMIDELRQDKRWERNREEGLLEASRAVESASRQLELRNMMEVFVVSLEQEVSPVGFEVFRSLYLRERDIEETMEELGLTRSSVHSHHKRVKKAVHAVWSRLFSDASAP